MAWVWRVLRPFETPAEEAQSRNTNGLVIEEVVADQCEAGNALVFRKLDSGASYTELQIGGSIVRSFAYGKWNSVKRKEIGEV